MNSLNTVCLLMYFYAIDLCASMCAHLSVIVKYTSLWKHSVDSLLLFLCMHAPLPPTPPPTPQKKKKKKEELWFVQQALDTKVLTYTWLPSMWIMKSL